MLLSPEAQRTVAAAPGLHPDARAIVKHLLLRGGDCDDAPLAACLEFDRAVAGGEDRVVSADPGTGPGAELRAPLADEDHPRLHGLAVVDLHAEPLGLRVAAVPGGTESFLVCHLALFLLLRARRLARGRLLRVRRRLRADRRDLDLRQRAAVARMTPVARAPAVLADADLLALHVAQHLGRDLDLRLEVGLSVAASEQNVGVKGLALVGLDPVHKQLLALMD